MRAAGLDFQNSNLELQNSRLTRVVTFTGPRTGYRQQDLPSRAQRAAYPDGLPSFGGCEHVWPAIYD